MRGDFTRNTFDPVRNFSRVLMQQGRVTLDADWNEQASILLHYMRMLTLDVFGPHAGPADNVGFELISPLAATTWKERMSAVVVPILGQSETDKLAAKMADNDDILILPGRYYVGGLPVMNARPVLYSEQKGYPFFDPDMQIGKLKDPGLPVLFYLDVWERHVTALEYDEIREVALGGPDTCTRAMVDWQVRAIVQPHDLSGLDPATGAANFTCAYVDTLPQLGTGKLRARARLDKPPTELCTIPPESRYRGMENHLYRVEIHKSGVGATWPAGPQTKGQVKTSLPADMAGHATPDFATFVWSRENGSVVFPLQSLADPTAVVTFLGRDQRLTLEQGDLVEVMDDALAAAGMPGPLAQVQAVDPDKMIVTLQFATSATAPSYEQEQMHLRPRLIRWDKAGDMTKDGALPVQAAVDNTDLKSGWIELEDGVQIRFNVDGNYRAGDYWLIPARTITGDVDWPHEYDSKGVPVKVDGNPVGAARQPLGVDHHYASLLLFTPAANGVDARANDCRCLVQRQCMAKTERMPDVKTPSQLAPAPAAPAPAAPAATAAPAAPAPAPTPATPAPAAAGPAASAKSKSS